MRMASSEAELSYLGSIPTPIRHIRSAKSLQPQLCEGEICRMHATRAAAPRTCNQAQNASTKSAGGVCELGQAALQYFGMLAVQHKDQHVPLPSSHTRSAKSQSWDVLSNYKTT